MHRRFRLPRGHAASASLLEKGIRPRAFAPASEGSVPQVRVALRPDWPALLGGLAQVGKVWRITRNRHASLGLRSDGYPRLHLSPHGVLAVDAAGSVAADFGAWRRAWAVEATPPCGHRAVAAEFEDARGEVFHKVCVPGDSPAGPGRFALWARAHQADRADEAEADTRFFREATPAAAPGALDLPGGLLRDALLAAAEANVALRVAVQTDGLHQAGTIRVLDAAESNGWLRMLGDGAALFAETEPLGLLRVEPTAVEGERSWRLALVHPDGRRWLELDAGADDREAWSRLVSDRLLRGPKLP